MARLVSGILGGFSGKVGTVIGFIRKGVSCIRGLAAGYTDANTLAQQSQRAKWSLILLFLKRFVQVIRVGFNNVTGSKTPFNAALSYNVKNAVAGMFPNFIIDYTKVKFSQGNLTGALIPLLHLLFLVRQFLPGTIT